MRGDFSKWRFDRLKNFNGVLQQQGRVIIDSDATDGERIGLHWREQAAQDVIGSGVAAVPATEPNGFRVASARFETIASQPTVTLTVEPGRAWADGLLTYLAGDPEGSNAAVTRRASYFELPVQPPPPNPTGAVRDAVVLELSHQEMSGFQMPDLLLDPALGDLDTAERIHTSFRFRLFRLGAGQDCHSIRSLLDDDPSAKGGLTATLTPTVPIAGDCPVVKGGGYTGFEHHLYRIEVAHRGPVTPPYFKVSRSNGGLVGRGTFNAAVNPKRVAITANRAAIVNSDRTNFYLEALSLDADHGYWRPTYGALATLNADNELALTDPPFFGTVPAGGSPVFFRLWDELRPVADFTNVANPVELVDGIHLAFDPPNASGSNYRPGDFWTFPVRVGQSDPSTLVPGRPPEGVGYHRVVLAEIQWSTSPDIATTNAIEDCRSRFLPLTSQKVCCTLLVGNGVSTFGDFNSLEEAAAALPASGGELCLLPGVHFANLRLDGRQNITIHGCARRTLVLPRPATKSDPIIGVKNSTGIRVAGLDLVSFDDIPIRAVGTAAGALKDVAIVDTRILGSRGCIRIDGGVDVSIARNLLWLLDRPQAGAALSIEADRVIIERNRFAVWPAATDPPGAPTPGDEKTDPADPCADSDIMLAQQAFVAQYAYAIWAILGFATPTAPYRAIGGIHVRAGSEDVLVLENHIQGGAGNGITLGGVLPDDVVPATPPPEGDAVPAIQLEKGRFTGRVIDELEQPLDAVDVHLQNFSGSKSFSDRSDASGIVTVEVDADTYRVEVSPAYEIVKIVESGPDPAGQTMWLIVVRPTTQSPDGRGFLYRVEVRANEIASMGLSGIGFGERPPRWLPGAAFASDFASSTGTVESHRLALLAALTPRDLLSVTDPVTDLIITGNRIMENLRNPFDAKMAEDAKRIGRGGISLAVCDGLVISDNHVLENGVSTVDPVCGIYVGYGDNVEIAANDVNNNGPATAGDQPDLKEGLRSGIFVRFAGPVSALDDRGPALRVHDNRVDQPVGRALTAIASGPVSCTDNHFNSEHTGHWGLFDLVVGGVLIVNVGGLQRLVALIRSESDGRSPIERASTRRRSTDLKAAERVLPGGETIFQGNQIRLGPDHRSITSIAIGTIDDLGFDSNQSAVFQDAPLLANGVLGGLTIRATDSRFAEAPEETWSLFSLGGRANITAHNIGDHCIVVRGPRPMSPSTGQFATVDGPNVELDFDFCHQFAERGNEGRYVTGFLTKLFQGGGTGKAVTGDLTAPSTGAVAVSEVGSAMHEGHLAIRHSRTAETVRVANKLGGDSPRVAKMNESLSSQVVLMEHLRNQSEVVLMKRTDPGAGGAVVEGRVTDVGKRGVGGLSVDLVDDDGEVVQALGKTNAQGNFVKRVERDNVAKLADLGDVFVRVTDPSGAQVALLKEPVRVQAEEIAGVEVVLARKTVFRGDVSTGRDVFNRPRPTADPADPGAKPAPPKPTPPPPVDEDDTTGEGPRKQPDPPPPPGGKGGPVEPPGTVIGRPRPPVAKPAPEPPSPPKPPGRPRKPKPTAE